MKDNRGLSLVELLITVTIVAIVIVSAAGFMLSGSRSFAKGSADSDVQSESELAVNQIEDLVIDVNGGVSYDDATESLIMYHVEKDDAGVAVYKKRSVTWDKSDTQNYKLKSSEWIVAAAADGSGSYEVKSTVYENELLAEKVTDFNVDLSDKITETGKDGYDIEIVRSVVIQVACLDATGKSSYATTPTITLRNRMMLSADPGTIFDNTTVPDDNLLLYISSTGLEGAVPIRDRVTEVERGKMYNIFAMVSAGTNVNSLCSWKVEGEESGCLSDINGKSGGEVFITLDVDESEPNKYLTITASYTDNPSKKATGVVKVAGGEVDKSFTAVKIDPFSYTPFNPKFRAIIEPYCVNLTKNEMDEITCTWSVSEPKTVEPFASTNRNLELRVIKEKGNYNKVLEIVLVAYCPATGETRSDRFLYHIDSEGTSDTGGDSLMERGKAAGEQDIAGGIYGNDDVWYSFIMPFWTDYRELEVYYCDAYGNRISEYDYLIPYIRVKEAGPQAYNLTFTKDLPPENEYYIKVIDHFYEYPWGYNPSEHTAEENAATCTRHETYERIHYIAAVHLWGETTNGGDYDGDYITSETVFNRNRFSFFYNVSGFAEREWANSNPPVYEYEVVEFKYDIEVSPGQEAYASVPEDFTITPIMGNATNASDRNAGECLRQQVSFEYSGIKSADMWRYKVTIYQFKVKITMKGHPSIYTYATVNFE